MAFPQSSELSYGEKRTERQRGYEAQSEGPMYSFVVECVEDGQKCDTAGSYEAKEDGEN